MSKTRRPDQRAIGVGGSEGTCSFCGKPRGEVKTMVHGPSTVAICNECAELVHDISNEELDPTYLVSCPDVPALQALVNQIQAHLQIWRAAMAPRPRLVKDLREVAKQLEQVASAIEDKQDI